MSYDIHNLCRGGLSSTGLLPIAVIFSIYIKGRWSGMKAGHPKRAAHRGQTWGLIKARPSQAQTGLEVRHIKSTGSKVRQRTDLHLTLRLEMVISRCSGDLCLTARDDTAVGDTGWAHVGVHVCGYVCAHTHARTHTHSDQVAGTQKSNTPNADTRRTQGINPSTALVFFVTTSTVLIVQKQRFSQNARR